jgi:DNA repair exonuclease SbcCD nuclease subunit
VVFAGNPQGRDAYEEGEKSCELVEVIAGRIKTVTPRPTSQVVWHRSVIDTSDAQNVSDVYEKLEQELRAFAADDRLHCVRVELVGECAAHAELVQDRIRAANEVRQCAANVTDRIWVEQIHLHTKACSGTTLDSGPIGEIDDVVRAFKAGPAALDEVMDVLKQLNDKLPAELREGREPISLNDGAFLHNLIDEARADLVASLSRGVPR